MVRSPCVLSIPPAPMHAPHRRLTSSTPKSGIPYSEMSRSQVLQARRARVQRAANNAARAEARRSLAAARAAGRPKRYSEMTRAEVLESRRQRAERNAVKAARASLAAARASGRPKPYNEMNRAELTEARRQRKERAAAKERAKEARRVERERLARERPRSAPLSATPTILSPSPIRHYSGGSGNRISVGGRISDNGSVGNATTRFSNRNWDVGTGHAWGYGSQSHSIGISYRW